MSAFPASAVDALILLIERAPTEEAIKVALKTIATIVGNAADPAKGLLKTSNAGLQKRVLGLEGGEISLVALGFVADAAAGTLTWDASLPSDAAAARAAAVSAVLSLFDAVASAIGSVGDTNAPAAAKEALKLCGTYIGNIGAAPDAPERRRIAAANKALNGRLLSCQGGMALLLACGFSPEPAQGEAEAYVCSLELPMIVIKSLPSRAELTGRAEARDMQPGLCKSDNGIHAQLYTYQCASKQWQLQGAMEIPGGEFVWETLSGPKTPCVVIQVDLGDAHGSGKPVPLQVPLVPAAADSSFIFDEYVASRDFISKHEADSYANMKDPLLNMNYLEEIARKIRAAVEPVLLTVARLKTAMIDQH